jgi:ribosome-binding protein aMBF1 (putative translation factor)
LIRKASKTTRKKRRSNKPFRDRFPERKSAAARILADNVRRLRKERGLSQKDVAGLLDVDQAMISLIELRRANPTLSIIEQIAKKLRVTTGELLTKPAK